MEYDMIMARLILFILDNQSTVNNFPKMAITSLSLFISLIYILLRGRTVDSINNLFVPLMQTSLCVMDCWNTMSMLAVFQLSFAPIPRFKIATKGSQIA